MSTNPIDARGQVEESRQSSHAVFTYEVEGTSYEHDRPKITGGEIMDTAGIPRDQGLIQVHPDGTTTSIRAEEEVHLVPAVQFKRRPRFKRGQE